MQDWQIELAKAFGLAVIAFLSGYGTYWLKNRERMAELVGLKAKQRLEGSSEAARLERAAKVTEMMIVHRQDEITPTDFKEFFDDVLNKRRKKKAQSIAGPSAAITAERGPNGGRVEILPNGDKVEWIHDDDLDEDFSMILLRGEKQLHQAEEEYFDKVWWNRHQVWREKIEAGEEPPPNPEIWAKATAAAKRIENKYGEENLGWDDFDWGMVNGKLSALRWVLGDEWDFLDT